MRFVLITLLGLSWPLIAQAQSQDTLADIRQELSVLNFEIQNLKRELSTTSGASTTGNSGSLLERANAFEAQLTELTAKTEELEFRISRIVQDGSNRIDDLEFRVCELDAACDIGAFVPGSTLGDVGGALGIVTQPDPDEAPQLAIGEETDFAAADAALQAGDFAQAADRFADFRETYPGSPLAQTAALRQGQALEASGNLTQAARTYLTLFSSDQTGPMAPDALYHLGAVLGQLGQRDEACVTLGEVSLRFPTSGSVGLAQGKMTELGCG